MALPPLLILKVGLWWHKNKPLRKLGIRKDKEKPIMMDLFKGKLTYGSIAIVIILKVLQVLGVEVVEAEASQVTEALALVVAIFGRWRATK